MKAYTAPVLREYGLLDQLTLGSECGNSDFGKGETPPVVGPPGNPTNGNEGNGSSTCGAISS